MGSIYSTNTRPETWPIHETRKLKPEYGGELIVSVSYGWCDDYPEGELPLNIWIRQTIYEKLLSGTYIVKPRQKGELVILDEKRIPIAPLRAGFIY